VYWVRYHIRHLRRWRQAAKAVAEAVKTLGLKARVYVIGGAAEDRLTVLSDVDVLVCLDREDEPTPAERRQLKHAIIDGAIDRHGLPWDYPLDLHIHGARECRRILEKTKAVLVG